MGKLGRAWFMQVGVPSPQSWVCVCVHRRQMLKEIPSLPREDQGEA